jgi:hypothetical protein
MRSLNVRYRDECYDKQWDAGRFNPATEAVFTFKHREYVVTLDCGHSDNLHAYRDGDFAIFLSINERLEYAGVLVYDLVEDRVDSELFCKDSDEIEQEVGRQGLNLAPVTIARRLYERCLANWA